MHFLEKFPVYLAVVRHPELVPDALAEIDAGSVGCSAARVGSAFRLRAIRAEHIAVVVGVPRPDVEHDRVTDFGELYT